MMSRTLKLYPFLWAKKTVFMMMFMMLPSLFMTAPMGTKRRTISGLTFSFVSSASIVLPTVALLEENVTTKCALGYFFHVHVW